MSTHPADEPDDHGEHAEVAARLHDSLTAPALDPAVRARHVQALRERAAALPTPAGRPGAAATPSPAPAPAAADAPAGHAGRPAPHRVGRRLASTTAAAGLVLVMGASGAVAAAHQSLPGETLYRVKAATEQLVLAAPLSIGRSVERHLTFAQRRLDEARDLVAGARDPALVLQALTAHTRLMARAGELAGSDADAADRVAAATVVARRQLDRLLAGGLPDAAADQAHAALEAGNTRLERRPAPAPSPPESRPTPDPRPDAAPRPRPTTPRPAPEATSPPADRVPAPGPPATPAPGAPAPGPPAAPVPGTSLPVAPEPGGPTGSAEPGTSPPVAPEPGGPTGSAEPGTSPPVAPEPGGPTGSAEPGTSEDPAPDPPAPVTSSQPGQTPDAGPNADTPNSHS
ncbi:MAG: DUF5667 domain-containing protein [Egibacteraceae bacterium]